MNERITEISIVKKLQEFLYNNNLLSKFDFSISVCSSSFIIDLHEINKFGWKVIVYDSNDPFSEEIENEYEEDKIPYDVAVIRQIQNNLQHIIKDLSFINSLLK